MLVINVDNKNIWSSFLLENNSSILQSWQWGELQKNCGRKVYRLAVKEGSDILLGAQVISYPLPFGKSYLYCPRGPIAQLKTCPESYRGIKNLSRAESRDEKIKIILKGLLQRVREIAVVERAIFLRIDPEIEEKSELAIAMEGLGFKAVKKQVQPQNTLWLDLSLGEADLLAGMHHKTRYNIHLAERKGIVIRQSNIQSDVDIFFALLQETAVRDDFSAHPREYYQRQLKILGQDNLLRLFLAEYQGKVIAGALVAFGGDKAVYLHGASG